MGPGIIRLATRRLLCAWAPAAALLLAAAQPAQAQEIATARMSATVEQPISIINDGDMDFGKIAYTTTGGTVTLSPNASATCATTGGLIRIGNCRAAKFEGDAGFLAVLRVKRPNGNSIVLSGPAGATMLVDNFTFGAGPGLVDLGANGVNRRFWILNLDGSYTFYVGGRLTVGASQAPGVYTGTFEIQISYN